MRASGGSSVGEHGPAPRLGHVAHASPDRVRFRVERANRRPDVFERIERELKKIDGVASVEVNPRTGSILIRVKDRALDVTALDDLGHALGLIPPDVTIESYAERKAASEPSGAATATALELVGAGLGALVASEVGGDARVGAVAGVAVAAALNRLGRAQANSVFPRLQLR